MAVQSINPAGELYVHRIDELRREIGHAMAAISLNKLGAFEESLWRQEVLCTGLRNLLTTAQDEACGTILGIRLQSSLSALREVNRSYAELLRQAQTSNSLLHALCQAHCPNPQHTSTPLHCSVEA